MAEASARFCEQENCPLESEGKCLEGFNPADQCPHIKSSSIAVGDEVARRKMAAEDEKETEENKSEIEALMPIPFGDDLTEASCRSIMSAQLTRLIVIAGESESGKTTLLTSIYESFQRGSLAGYFFAGSQTLPGFEHRCHPARIASGRSTAETMHTKRGEKGILHLQVAKQVEANFVSQQLLLADVSGEDFKDARNSVDDAKQLHIVRRADHFLLLLNGAHLIDLSKRQRAMENARMLLLSLLDAQMLGDWSLVDVLFNKNDVMESHDDQTGLEQFLQHLTDSFKQRYELRLGRLRFYRIAARPPQPIAMEKATKLDLLFPDWVEESNQFSAIPNLTATPRLTTGREFDLFLERALPRLASGGER